jgi:hypothetical protein
MKFIELAPSPIPMPPRKIVEIATGAYKSDRYARLRLPT